jgi:ATP-dependent Zn protease
MNNFMRNVLVWAILGSFIMFILNSVENTNTRETISYSEFKQDVLSDRVAKVIYKGVLLRPMDGHKNQGGKKLWN